MDFFAVVITTNFNSFFEEHGYQILLHDYRFHYASSQDGDLETCNFANIAKDLHELFGHLEIKTRHFGWSQYGSQYLLRTCSTLSRRY